MEPYKEHTGIVALLNKDNIDTDQIIPKQFLKKVERSGFGEFLFYDWRFNEDGSDNPDFELNQPRFEGASILLTGDNFGCGSSREHAPWALEDYGFKIIIAKSFADIFFNNCFKVGILPIQVDARNHQKLVDEFNEEGLIHFRVGLKEQKIATVGQLIIDFEIDDFKKDSLLKGMDNIAWTLEHQDKIKAFEQKQKQELPWL